VIVDINKDTLEEGKKVVESSGMKVRNRSIILLLVQAEFMTRDADLVFRKVSGSTGQCYDFAGVLVPSTHTFETELLQFQKAMAVNCTGVFLCAEHELKQMMKQDSTEVYALPFIA
jgi:hypothetical protein